MVPVIVAAFRPTAPERSRNWRYAHDRWATLGIPVIAEDSGTQPFSRAGSRNKAVRSATVNHPDWDVALIVDTDVILDDTSSALAACEHALATSQLTYPHDHLIMLERPHTDEVVAGVAPRVAAAGLQRHPNTWSQALAVPRPLWDEVCGYDERFIDWGWEDLAFMAACQTLGGGLQRLHGDAYHLWHPRTRAENEDNPYHAANQVLGSRYLELRGSWDAMRALIAERTAACTSTTA